MKMIRPTPRVMTIASLAFILAPAAAFAAEPAMISKIGGKDIVLQHGDQSLAPRVQSLLEPGDRVSAGKGSFVEVEYLADGCSVRVGGGYSIVIAEKSPCAASVEQTPAAASAKKTAAAAAPAAQAKIEPAAAEADAAEVTDTSGSTTRVNRGDGLKDLSVGANLKAGDKVFAGKRSSITLYFPGGNCQYVVPESTVYTITDEIPCTAAAGATEGTGGAAPVVGLMTAAAAGTVALVVILNNEKEENDDNDGDGVGNPGTPQ
ncbi:hypothetical protein [Aestuariivirga sp.]|uniref:hypothetical protein n=1 Tax=Aestuariivirga sp. TaxID=2650926 RepID=UPI003BA9A6DD